jgi:hypothetical protein
LAKPMTVVVGSGRILREAETLATSATALDLEPGITERCGMSLGAVRRLRAALGLRTLGVLSMGRSVWRICGWNRAQIITVAVPDSGRVPVIFCTWKRLDRLPLTLEMLAEQDMAVQALIWDNSGQAEVVSKAVADANIPVAVHHSSRNIGGFGRFYLARAAGETGHQAVVFIDDDQNFGPEAIRNLLSARKPRSICSAWAFRFTGKHYYDRERCAPGEAAHYLGTGAMAADAAIFTDPRLFTCPRRFWFVEDLWLCFVAQHFNEYALTGSSALMREVTDGRNQSWVLWWVKDRLRRYMARRGWPRASA